MLHDLIITIRGELQKLLIMKVGPGVARRYLDQWYAGSLQLVDKNKKVEKLFSELLIHTQQINSDFGLGSGNQKVIKETIFYWFTHRDQLSQAASGNQQPAVAVAATTGTNPSAEISGQQNAFNQKTSGLSTPRHEVFLAFLAALSEHYDAKTGMIGMLKLDARPKISQIRISVNSRVLIERWVRSEHFTGNFDTVSDEEMREIVDGVYELFCNQFGPVNADAMFSDAAISTEKIRASKYFSVRNLL